MFVGGHAVTMDAPPQIIDGLTFVPVRFVAQSADRQINWDDATRTVTIERSSADGISTLAGTGLHGAQDGARPQFNLPHGLVALDGNLLVADTYNNLIRQVNTVTGSSSRLAGMTLAFDDIRFPRGFYRDGAVSQALFNRPHGIAVHNDRIYIADSHNHTVRTIVDGSTFTLAGTHSPGYTDGRGVLAHFNTPTALAVDTSGNIFVADSLNHAIRRIDPEGNVTTVAGTPGIYGHTDGSAAQAGFNSPMGIALADDGRIFVADTGNHVIRVIEGGNVSTLAGRRILPEEVSFTVTHAIDEWDHSFLGGYEDSANGLEAQFSRPIGLAFHNGTLIVADSANHRIRAVRPSGEVVTIAGSGESEHKDGPALQATFLFPTNVHIYEGTLFIADGGNNMIRTANIAALLGE
jgi:sugar lactone lactonase YvrE